MKLNAAALGHDCVSALRFLPDGIDPGAAGDGEIPDMLNNLAAAPLGLARDEDFRISIAGARENAQRQAAAVVDKLPQRLPEQLITSVTAAIAHRAGLLAAAAS